MSRSDDLALIESGMLSARGVNNAVIRGSKVLTAQDTGFVLADASAGQLKITLPIANRPMDIRVQRLDNTANRLLAYAADGERIRFHTHLRSEGYPFCMVLGGGDFWHLRSDGAGSWVLIDRLDKTAVGRIAYDASTALNPGGWGIPDAALLNRADWPWLWDYAQQSGMLVSEAGRTGMEGCWTSGDESTLFRLPDLRGEFIRGFDETRGLDVGRQPGARQLGSVQVLDSTVQTGTVTGLYNPTTPENEAAARAGLDPMNVDEYGAGATFIGIGGGSAGKAVNAPNNFGITRPRNIAQPVRIKLI
ncbi:MAG: phage tail protein [Pseudomonas farsensis]|uniref:phage tail protein n=1 Tax=Pseudomonas farsensis TaxID=2745492 RepID=UPI003C7DBB10